MTPALTKNKIPLITLVGQPNSGKTTLFNYLSGKNFKTVNYPGSTVEYSISKILSKFSINANILDSPGIISLIPSSPDEKISVDSLFSHPKFGKPEIVIITVDSSQLSRHLYLVKQLIDANFNVIVVLTMLDLLRKKNLDISESKLSSILGCKVLKIDSRTGKGLNELLLSLKDSISEISDNEELFPEQLVNTQKEKLLESYRHIEEIEKEVLFRKDPDNGNKNFDISEANKKLVVLNSVRLPNKPDAFTLKVDKFTLHRYWGILIFFLVMAVTFTSIFWLASPLMEFINEVFSLLSSGSEKLFGDTLIGNLISNGLINGLGSVLVFLPQILILFMILGLLEDSGYLARGAMLADKPLSMIGLNGKSFVPMLSGFACAIPAIMATRTISNRRERFLTIFIIPLMSCSARIPVYALLIAFLIPQDKPWIGGIAMASIYIFSIFSSLLIASLVNKFREKIIRESDSSSFILELPAYRKPKLQDVLNNTIKNATQYLKKAGPIIIYLSLFLWVLTYFPNTDPQVNVTGKTAEEVSELKNSERIMTSYASSLGKIIEPVMKPLGLDWRVGVSLIATFAAREVFVSSLALIFKITEEGDNIQASILKAMKEAKIEDTGEKLFTTATTTGLIIFFVFAMQCLSTVAISRKETGSWRIPALQIIVFSTIAYVVSFLTVTGLRFFGIN
ncbi:MAG: ferrous iron transport protein B [Bacteroidetes bacterium]|nr:ferrous iron transport protein B [Bacteroidota bacterium]